MPSQPDTYEDLVEKLFDDRLSGDELHKLNDVLRQSPQAREHYWHLVMLEGNLADLPGWIAGQKYATQLAFSETLEAFIEMEENAVAELQTYPDPSESDKKDGAHAEPIRWQDVRTLGGFYLRSLARQKATWGVAAAAMVCIVALAYAIWFGGGTTQTPAEKYAGSDQDTSQVQALPAEPVVVAVVLNQSMPTGGPAEANLSPGTELTEGELITLPANSAVELKYASGATAILQGPGEYTLHSPERIGMQHGRISAVVPPLAKGFTVATTKTDFIDHGTEFAVTLDKEGHGDIVVLDGLIEARPARTDKPQTLDQPESIMLQEGFGGVLIPDDTMPVSVQPIGQEQVDRYTRNWDAVVYRPQLSGQITYATSPPASLELGQTKSTDPLLFAEQRGVVLGEDLHLNSNKTNGTIIKKRGDEVDLQADYVIPAGTKLNSFLIHLDLPKEVIEGSAERDFKLEFNGRIVAVIEMQKYQYETDGIFGLADTRYPQSGSMRGASDPPGHPNFDYLYVSDDLRTLSVKMRLSGMDQIRVLVENTDP